MANQNCLDAAAAKFNAAIAAARSKFLSGEYTDAQYEAALKAAAEAYASDVADCFANQEPGGNQS